MTDLPHAGPVRVTRSRAAGILAICLAGFSYSCGSSSSSTSTPTTPAPTTVTLSGTVTDAASGAVIANAAVAISGKNATTGADGKYSIAGLTAGASSLTVQHQGHINFTQSVTLSGSATTTDVKMTPSLAATAAGTWTGSWRNSTFGSTGTVSAVVTVDTVAQTVTVVLDVNGNVFGGPDPKPETLTGPYTTAGANVTTTSATYGTVNIKVNPDGTFTGSCTNVPTPGIARCDFTGSVVTSPSSKITMSYTVTFTSGATAAGTATLTK